MSIIHDLEFFFQFFFSLLFDRVDSIIFRFTIASVQIFIDFNEVFFQS